MFKVKNFLITLTFLSLLNLLNVHSYEYQLGFERWRISFADPSRTYRLRLTDRVQNDYSWFDYVRTDRFGFHDNTFGMGWRQWEKIWGWEMELGITPHAEILFREKYRFGVFVPSILWARSEPRLAIEYRRHNEAAVLEGTAGIRQPLGGGFDISAEASRTRNRFIGITNQRFWANGRRFEAGYALRGGSRAGYFQGKRKEFFESGSPIRSAYTTEENGGYFSWNAGGTSLNVSYSHESRSNNTFVDKFSASAGLAF